MIADFLASWPLFQHTYLAGWLIGVVLALIGVVVVARDQIFLGAAVSQASMLGIAVGMLFGSASGASDCSWCRSDWALSVWGGCFAVVGALAPSVIRGESTEAVTGWVFITGASLAIVLMAHSPHGLEDIHRLMSSTIIGATAEDVAAFALLTLAAVGVLVATLPRVLLLVLDPEMAAAVGMRVEVWERVLSVVFGVAVGVSIRVAGMVYAFACLVLPALVARNVCREVRSMFLVAPLVALVSGMVAFVLANHHDLPPGQVGAALLAGGVALSWVVRAVRPV
ncbi:metal ABC transporter permease [Candidatus Binatia bacterium]|nr:metal ABC transporter permease [Candidatus Binatia bacterium]